MKYEEEIRSFIRENIVCIPSDEKELIDIIRMYEHLRVDYIKDSPTPCEFPKETMEQFTIRMGKEIYDRVDVKSLASAQAEYIQLLESDLRDLKFIPTKEHSEKGLELQKRIRWAVNGKHDVDLKGYGESDRDEEKYKRYFEKKD
jgi:hypothetical protein